MSLSNKHNRHNVLIINPNSTKSMTDSLVDLVGSTSDKVVFRYRLDYATYR